MIPTVEAFKNSFSNKLEEPVRQHLKNVYACLTMSTMAAAVGASIHLFTSIIKAGFMSAIGALLFYILLLITPDDDGKKLHLRTAYLLGFATCTGVGLGPILETVITLSPSLIITALLGTTLVFVSFSISSMLAERGKWLYLGGTLLALLNTTMLLSFANFFLGCNLLYQTNLYLGLVLVCGFVLYDTQLIIEKRRMGSQDFVGHSMDLFVDFLGVFRRILVLLTQKVISDRRRASSGNAEDSQ